MKPIYKVGDTVAVRIQRHGMICSMIGEIAAICPNYYVVRLDDGEMVSARAKQVSYYNRAWEEEEDDDERF